MSKFIVDELGSRAGISRLLTVMLAEPEGQHLSICAYVIATKQPDLVEKRFIALYTAAQVRAQAGGGKLIGVHLRN